MQNIETQQQHNEASMMKQFINGTENPHEVLVATITEVIGKAVGADMKATRKVNGYRSNQCLKPAQMDGLNKATATNPKQVSPSAIKDAGFSTVRFVTGTGQPVNRTLLDIEAYGLFNNRTVQRAMAALVSLKAYTDANTEATKKSGQDAIEVSWIEASKDAMQAFGLTKGDMVRYIEVDGQALIRDSFKSLKQLSLEKRGIYAAEKANRLERTTVHNYTLQGGSEAVKAHLTINTDTVAEWFSTYHPAQLRCFSCRTAFGFQQVTQHKSRCPQCACPKSEMGENSLTLHLPVLDKQNGGLKTYGGHRVHFKAVRLTKTGGVNLVAVLHDMMNGRRTTADAITALMHSDDGMSVVSTRRTKPAVGWGRDEFAVVPVSFDMCIDGQQKTLLGLALEARFKPAL
tara:strand:- start:1455 stop:2660 length:1206 start_codon:yes stop_codon:yes gene_type:complete